MRWDHTQRFLESRPPGIGCLLAAALLLAVAQARANTNVVTVQSLALTNRLTAYAQVEPIAVLPVRISEAGVLTHVDILPGRTVQAGQKLAELGGPEITAKLAQAEAAWRSAKTNLVAATKALAIQRQQQSLRLSTREMVLQAQSTEAQAQAAFDTTRARLNSLRKLIAVTAPAAGTVLAVNAADGERVMPGQTLLTLQPAKRLWLQAVFYGTDAAALHVGMSGQFAPADGGKPVPVKVSTLFAALSADGGESVGLVSPELKPGWLSGEFGTVTLNGPVRSLPVVPTRALILDRGQWWVLRHTSRGDRPQAVVPGPTRGWQTFVESGLRPGAEVVVENAYLQFHNSISKHYQPPD